MNKYQEALKNIRINANKSYVDVCYYITEKSKAMKYEDEIFKSCKVLDELVEKATPKKIETKSTTVNGIEIIHAICPNCKILIEEFEGYNGCPHCLQALDWSDE